MLNPGERAGSLGAADIGAHDELEGPGGGRRLAIARAAEHDAERPRGHRSGGGHAAVIDVVGGGPRGVLPAPQREREVACRGGALHVEVGAPLNSGNTPAVLGPESREPAVADHPSGALAGEPDGLGNAPAIAQVQRAGRRRSGCGREQLGDPEAGEVAGQGDRCRDDLAQLGRAVESHDQLPGRLAGDAEGHANSYSLGVAPHDGVGGNEGKHASRPPYGLARDRQHRLYFRLHPVASHLPYGRPVRQADGVGAAGAQHYRRDQHGRGDGLQAVHGGPRYRQFMPVPDAPTELFAALLAAPRRAAVFTDFDGTLAPIVDDPEAARPLPGVAGTLGQLARVMGVVAVVSGRPASFLAGHLLVPGVRLVGLYGMEQVRDDGRVVVHPEALRWQEVVEAVARRAMDAAPAGLLVEHKGLAVTLHYRQAPELAPWAWEWARAEATRTGLAVGPGRMSVELRPPIGRDKGSAVEELLEGVGAACFVGDDAGDLAAFDALDRAATSGVQVVRVAVRSSESPPGLLARADLVLDGPAAVVSLLGCLARRAVAEDA